MEDERSPNVPRSSVILFSCVLWCAPMLPAAAFGQARPDAGRLLEQVAPEPPAPEQSKVPLQVQERPAIKLPVGESIAVTRLNITGATRFPVEQLHAAIASEAEGKTLSLAQLQGVAQLLTNYYRERGYLLTRAYLPAQQIEGGVVEIAILEGRLSQVRIENEGAVKGPALAPLRSLPTDEPLSTSELEHALLLAADLPGVDIRSTLTPGASVGTSDLLVDVTGGRRFTGALSADTYGNRATGAARAGANVSFNNPLNVGDRLSVDAMASAEDLYHVRAGYQLPITPWGTRMGVSYAWLDYALGDEFEALDADGTAKVASLHLQQPFIRSRGFNLAGELQYDDKDLEDRLGAFDVASDKRLHNWTLGLSGDFRDSAGRGANAFGVHYTRGRLDLDPLSRVLDSFTARSGGHFGRWNLGYQRLQSFTPAFSLYFSYEGQLANGNLDSAEKMSLGGAYGVRAYPQGEAAADEAQLFSLEARLRLPLQLLGDWQLTSFIDHGQARLSKDPWSVADNHRELTGAGVGLNLSSASSWSLKASVAWRLGDERATSDSDKSPRGWLHAATYF